MRKMRGLFANPRFRHGGYAALTTALLLCAVVLVCVSMDALESEFALRRDLSFNSYATSGEVTREVLDGLSAPVHVYALFERGAEDLQLLELLSRYAALSANFTYEAVDIARNPGLVRKYQGTADDTLSADSLIVACEATGRYKLLSPDSFITLGYDIDTGSYQISGLQYEKQLTEAVAYVTSENIPVIQVLTGHGEVTGDALATFTDYLTQYNYQVETVSLLAGGALDPEGLLMALSPQRDLSDTEVAAIGDYLAGGGRLFVTRDTTDDTANMPNWLALLRSYGVVPLEGVVVAGASETNTYYTQQLYLLPNMRETELTRALIDGGMNVLLLAGASAFETPSATDTALTATEILASGSQSYLRDPSDGNVSIERQAGDKSGPFTLAIAASRMHANGNVSRAFVIGSSSPFTDDFMYQRTFGGEFAQAALSWLLPTKPVSLNIAAKAALHPELKPVSQTVGVALIAALPLLVLLAALLVLLPRKNR